MKSPGAKQLKIFREWVDHFTANRHLFEVLISQVQASVISSKTLTPLIHSWKSRIKDPEHLKDKLIRKYLEYTNKGKIFPYTKENLFSNINDLAGFRILHLHTSQFEKIDQELRKIFAEQAWVLVGKPEAKTWDDESRAYFKKIGIKVVKSPSMYTSIHYVIKSNSKVSITCEIQVRTLMEEVWGEVTHTIDYPHPSKSHSCREQIKTLARVTSSCTRLVDSIFSTHQYEQERDLKLVKKSSRRKAK
ncbi:MAG: RelA/SpoT domain-containing protein [Bacteroidia bacterium]|nr:RelA/SpoT domain-containing protein [Bacteroidia bacterium]MBP7773202.1 RelA/SpoT domain-containing protein [Bacteroidia bacterium]